MLALIVFCVIFQWTLAFVILLVMVAYGSYLSSIHVAGPDNLVAVSVSYILAKWRSRLKRKMNERDTVSLCKAF